MKRFIALLLALIITTPVPALSNRGYGFLMLEEPVSPRSTAMGSAGAALGGRGFRYYNPAQPFFSPSLSSYASAEFGQMPGGVNMGGVETALLSPNERWWGAISFFSSALDFITSDERGLGATALSGTTVGALSAGYIYGSAAAGVAISMAEDRIGVENSYSAFALSLGLGYKLLDDKLALGAAWMHLGARSRGFGDNASLWHDGRVPVSARAGAAWSDTLLSIPYTVAADIVYRDENGTFSAPVGLEVSPLPYVNIRIGKRIGWESEVLSMGIGLSIDRITFDAAFVPSVFVDNYEMKWSMGFTYSMGFGRKKEVGGTEEPVPTEESRLTDEAGLTDGDDVSTDEPVSTDEAVLTDGEDVSTDEPVSTDEAVLTDDEDVSTEESVPTEEPALRDVDVSSEE